MRCCFKHGFETLNLNRIFLRVYADNPRAIRAYEKAGMAHEGRYRQGVYKNGAYRRRACHERSDVGMGRKRQNKDIYDWPKVHHNPEAMQVYGGIKLYAGTARRTWRKKIAEYLGEPLCGRDMIEFPNENLFVKLHSSVRGQDVLRDPDHLLAGAPQPDGAADH